VSLEGAVARIREASAEEPLVGVVLGSGLGALADELDRTPVSSAQLEAFDALGRSIPL